MAVLFSDNNVLLSTEITLKKSSARQQQQNPSFHKKLRSYCFDSVSWAPQLVLNQYQTCAYFCMLSRISHIPN